jgi:hypothetical protein
MPYLPPVNPPVLSLELDRTSERPLGAEILFYTGHQGQPQRLDELRSAIGRIATSTDPYLQRLKTNVDERFVQDTAGAPEEFEFRRLIGESIFDLLAQSDPQQLSRFCT